MCPCVSLRVFVCMSGRVCVSLWVCLDVPVCIDEIHIRRAALDSASATVETVSGIYSVSVAI